MSIRLFLLHHLSLSDYLCLLDNFVSVGSFCLLDHLSL